MGSNQDSKRTQGHRTEGTTASMSNKESFHAARRPYDFQSSAISRAGIGAQFTDRSGTGFEAERSSGHPYPENLDFVNPNLEDNQDHTTARNIKDRSKVALSRTEELNSQTERQNFGRAEYLLGRGQEKVQRQDLKKGGNGAKKLQ